MNTCYSLIQNICQELYLSDTQIANLFKYVDGILEISDAQKFQTFLQSLDSEIHNEDISSSQIKSKFYKSISNYFAQRQKEEYLKSYIPLNLATLQKCGANIQQEYEKFSKLLCERSGNSVTNNFQNYFNQNTPFLGVVNEDGLLYLFNRKESIKSHDEIIELLNNGYGRRSLFLEVGSSVATSKNGYPVIRVQDIVDTNGNLHEGYRNYIISPQLALSIYSIFELFNAQQENPILFEEYLLHNVSHLGFDNNGHFCVWQKNAQIFSDVLCRKFDANFFEYLAMKENNISFDNNIMF